MPTPMSNSFPQAQTISRRHVLQLFGLAAAGGALAACRGGDTSEEGDGGSGTVTAEFQAAYPYDPPPKGHFNLLPGVTDAIKIGLFHDVIVMPGAMFLWAEQSYFYLLADESSGMSADGKTFTYVVRPDLTWSDGKPVTAADVYGTWLLEQILGHKAFTYVESFEQSDDMTVTFHLEQPAPIVEYWVLRTQIVAAHVYQELVEAAEPLVRADKEKDDPDVGRLAKEIAEFRPDEVTASGPFTFDYRSITNAQLTLVKNEKGYRAADIPWQSVIVHNGETEAVTPLVLAKKVYYATHGFPVATDKELQQQGFRILRPPVYDGPALYLNYGKRPEFRDKRVRQALAHAVDRQQMGTVTLGESAKAPQYMTGFFDVLVPNWLSEADMQKLTDYSYDPDRAEQLLTEAGWRKDGARWITSEGKPARYEVIFPQVAQFTASSQNLANQLGAFGFDLTLRAMNNTQVPLDIGESKFQLAMWPWGLSSSPFPTDALSTAFLTFNYVMQEPNRGIDFPLKQQTDVVGEIDLETAVPDSAVGTNLDEQRRKVTKIALAFNELLPIIPMYERYGNNPVLTSEVDGFPAEGDPLYENSIYADNFTTILMFDGKLRPA